MARRSPSCTLFPYTTLFRSIPYKSMMVYGINTPPSFFDRHSKCLVLQLGLWISQPVPLFEQISEISRSDLRSEEHTSELQSQSNLVCRLLLEKKNRSTPRRA